MSRHIGKRITVTLDPDVSDAITQLSEEEGLGFSAALRKIVRIYTKDHLHSEDVGMTVMAHIAHGERDNSQIIEALKEEFPLTPMSPPLLGLYRQALRIKRSQQPFFVE